jgi:hypothetical protein
VRKQKTPVETTIKKVLPLRLVRGSFVVYEHMRMPRTICIIVICDMGAKKNPAPGRKLVKPGAGSFEDNAIATLWVL